MAGVGSTLTNIGNIYMSQNRYAEGIDLFKKAVVLSQQTEDYKSLSNAYHNLGLAYNNISDYETAIEYYLQALKIEEEVQDYSGLAQTLSNIATIFIDWKNPQKALEYLFKALELAEAHGQVNSIIQARTNIGLIYDELGKYDQALAQYYIILKDQAENEYNPYLSSLYLNLGETYENLMQYDSAYYYYQKTFNLRQKLGNNEQLAAAYGSLGKLMFKQENYDKSIEYLTKSNELASDKKIIAYNYVIISEIYENRKNFPRALKFYKQHVAMRDSLFLEEQHKQIYELQIQYEAEKKEQQIESLEKVNESKARELRLIRLIFVLIVSAGLIIAFSGAILFHNRQLQSKKHILSTEQKLLRSQMNPHFIFNSLSAIQSYILKNKSLEAGSYLSRFAKLMRSILDNSSKEFITLEDEIETLENYLNLQKIRLQNKLEYSIHVDKSMAAEVIMLPPMLSQPFIENAIEHGILKKENQGGRIDVRFLDRSDHISLEVEDDGIGRKQAAKSGQKKHRSRAIEITKDRMILLSKYSKVKLEFNIIDLFDEHNTPCGTKVIFRLPMDYS
ncbi:hypothetical protein ES708_20309 [subsurface metagenome]